jgi:hypothetical protein
MGLISVLSGQPATPANDMIRQLPLAPRDYLLLVCTPDMTLEITVYF